MSLYTPVFPPTDPPAARTLSSSSISSVETHKRQHGLSYSSRLSQWHLAIAALPYELCPPSAPPSPSSQERSAKLQAEIEKAVREGRNITDFCKLRSTKLGYATKQPAHDKSEQGDGVPWILAETEEEWFEWERRMAERRGKQKGKGRAILAPPPATQSRNAHDKVLDWKARLLPPGSTLATASPSPSTRLVRSSLGFPVVKPSTVAKGNKVKAKSPTIQDSASRPRFDARTDGEQDCALRPNTRAINAVYVNADGAEHSNAFTASALGPNPPSEAKEAASAYGEPENINGEVCDLSAFPPPSFPSDLVTSTQKDAFGPIKALDAPPLSIPLDMPMQVSNEIGNTDLTVTGHVPQEPQRDELPTSKNQIEDNVLAMRPDRQMPQPTPPSPPYSSEPCQPQVKLPDAPESAAEIIHVPATPSREFTRPLTPPPETERSALGPQTPDVSSGMQNSPRTSEKRRKSLAVPHGASFDVGHITPEAAINGASVVRAMGMNMPYPRTPERNRQVLPDPLTTSRKSRPRPRPPSRKHSAQNMDVDRNVDMDGAMSEMGADPSPAKSDRSYFSSPASGSSSGSDISRGSMLFVPGSPTSPLAYTQNPSRFAPLAQSTQVSSRIPLDPSSPTASRSRQRTRAESQNQSKKHVGMSYNSQFDVDARVDQLSSFMRQDVDFDAWVRNTDTEEDEDEVVAVEEMTKAFPASPFGS